MNASRTLPRPTTPRQGRSDPSSNHAPAGTRVAPSWGESAPTTSPPLLFGEPAVLAELDADGSGQPVIGGPAELPPEQWLYLAYGGVPTASQRQTADQVMQLAYGPGANRCSVSVFRPYLAVRSPVGAFLLARDDRGWYVAAIARGVAGPPVRTFGELRRAATWWQSPEVAAA